MNWEHITEKCPVSKNLKCMHLLNEPAALANTSIHIWVCIQNKQRKKKNILGINNSKPWRWLCSFKLGCLSCNNGKWRLIKRSCMRNWSMTTETAHKKFWTFAVCAGTVFGLLAQLSFDLILNSGSCMFRSSVLWPYTLLWSVCHILLCDLLCLRVLLTKYSYI